jgi:hypothetical protein
MPKRAEKNAEIPPPVPSVPPVDPAPDKPRDNRAVSDDRAVSKGVPTGEGLPSGEIGGPSGPEPTRYGDWEKKGRCIDF